MSNTTRRSESFAALAAALAKAQGEIEGASKDKVNPHFKSAYADLASVWGACRGPLSKNGLAVIQSASAEGPAVTVTTLLTHSSGEWIESALTMTAQQNTPQGIGSCLTYARRYALASTVGIAPEDDDGNAASRSNGKQEPVKAVPPHGFDEWVLDLSLVAKNDGVDALKSAWKASNADLRNYLTANAQDQWEAIKASASLASAGPA